MLRPAESWN